MHLRKAISSQPATYQSKWVVMAAFIVVTFILSASTVVLGQVSSLTPSEVSIIEAPLEAPLEDTSIACSDAYLEIAPDTELPQNQFFNCPPTQSQVVPYEEAICNCPTGPQSISLRKNVLGCKADYTIPATDEIWIVSARNNTCDPENVELLEVKKLTNNVWQPSCLDTLTESHRRDTGRATLVYVHGNQTNYEYGVARGFQLYDNLFIQHDCPRPPVRFVLWLWKSERELPRLYPDYLIKSERAVEMGRTLTKTLEAFGDRRLAITGFSLGAQVILSSLEEMEPKCGCQTPAMGNDKYQVALIAPATDPAYICDVIDRNVDSSIINMSSIIVNRADRAVKAMRVVVRRECPEARDMFSDLAREHHFPLGPMEFFEVSGEVSRKHAVERYTKSLTIKRAMNRVINRVVNSSY